ncbi:MAG: HEAT repeat domain-containing protein [Candidatus Wallbacteria bacterium]|nr:HEAT repeat domain-containing protein [Candidatus Wallbacteria bacterium]
MRYQDRLLSLLPAQQPQIARYVARELEGLVPYFDSGRVMQALETIAASEDPGAAIQGSSSLHRFYPSHLEGHYVPSGDPMASRMLRPQDLVSGIKRKAVPGGPPSERLPDTDALARSAVHLLEPAVHALLDYLPRLPAEARSRAWRTLARIPHGAVADSARKLAARQGAEALPAMLVAAAAHCRAEKEAYLVRLVSHLEGTPLFSAAIVALGLAPYAPVLELLSNLAKRGTEELHPSVAAALEGHRELGARNVLAGLSRRCSGWTALQILQSLGRLRDPAALASIESIFMERDHPSVREAAVRAAGSVKGPAAAQFLRRALEGNLHPTVAARALQSLQSVQIDPAELARLAAPWLDSSDPEAAVSALLASLMGQESAAAASLKSLIRSSNGQLRSQGAYCLGYYQGRASLEVLSYLAARDPDPQVRHQAVTSFATYELTQSVRERLTELLEKVEPRLTPVVASILGRPGAAGDSRVSEALIAAAGRAAVSGGPSVALLTAVARVGTAASREYLSGRLVESRDSEELLALLEAFDAGGAAADEARVRELAESGDGRLRAAAAKLLWNQGSESSVDLLLPLLRDGSDVAGTIAALAVLEDMALVGTRMATLPRFKELAGRLRDNLKTAAFTAMAGSAVLLAPSREVPPPAFDPNSSLLGRSPWHEDDGARLADISRSQGSGPATPGRKSGVHRPVYQPTFTSDGLDARAFRKRPLSISPQAAAVAAVVVLLCVVLAVMQMSASALRGSAARRPAGTATQAEPPAESSP